MADNTVNIGVNVSDNGSTARVTSNVQVLRDLLVNTAAIAAQLNVGGMGASPRAPRAAGAAAPAAGAAAPAAGGGAAATGGGGAGSTGGAAAPAAGGGTSGSRALSEQSRYGMFRGVAEETGSAAGNFSQQAQGANGLVRIYATLAANVYAASAAFAALSKAADISNLTAGLDMLGAASGKNLGAMAKRLVEVTEGGLSLANAMKATAKASSAGISTDNIERLGIVAKKSSQALGLDLSNAFDRLSRGVTKLEPELLDELGLFTKIGPATEAYARSMGKSVSGLTDFEKRQAFANAVLDEGEKKFGAIDLATNGYSIILAKLANGLQKVLEMANKVLKPIIDFLSQNPTALLLALGLLAKIMFGSLVPALTAWKESNKLVTESTQKKIDALREERASMLARRNEILGNSAAMRLQNAEDSRSLSLQKLLSDPNLTPKVQAALTSTSRIGEAGPQAPVTSAVGAITPDRLKVLEQAKRSLEQDIRARAGLYISAPGLAAKQAEDLKHLDQVIKAQKAATLAAKELNKVEAITTASRGEIKLLDAERKALLSLQKSNIVQNSLETQAIDGTRAGFRALIKELSLARQGFDINGAAFADSSKKLGFFSAVATMATGSVKLLTGALNALLGTLGRILMTIGIVTGVFQILNSIFSTSIKETANFGAASDLLDSALRNVGNTLDNISKKKFLGPESVQQTANAFNDLTDAARKQLKAFTELTTSQNSWDRFWEDIFNEIPGIKSNTDVLAQNLTRAIDQSIVLIKDEKLRAEFEKKLSGIYDPSGTKKERIAALKVAIVGGENIDFITKELDKVNAAINNAASSLTALDAGFTEISKQVTDIVTSTKLTDVEGKLGTSMLAEADRLTKAFKNSEQGLIALSKIVKDVNLITIFPDSVSRDLINKKEQILELSAAYQKASVEVTDLELRAKSAQGVDALIVEEQLAKARKVLSTIQASSKALVSQFDTKVTGGLIEQAFNKVGISLKNAIVEAGIISARGYVSILSSLGANTASMEADLKVKELQNQKAIARASYDLSQSLVRNRLAMEILTQTTIESNALKAIENASESKNKQAEDKANAFTTLQGAVTGNDLLPQDRQAIAKALPNGVSTSAESAKIFESEKTQATAGVEDLNKRQDIVSKLVLDAIAVVKTPLINTKQIIADAKSAKADAIFKRESLESSIKRFFAENGEGKANPKEIRKGAAETGTEASSIARELYVNMAGLEAVISKLDAQIGVTKLEGKAGDIRGAARKGIEEQQRKGTTAAESASGLKDQEKLVGIYNEQLVTQRQKYEVEASTAQKTEDNLKLNAELEVAQLLLSKIKDKNSEQGIKAIETEKELKEKITENSQSWIKKERKQTAEQLVERLTGVESLAVMDRERQTKTLEFENNIKQISIANLEAQLGMRQASGTVSDKELAIRTAELSISKQAIDYSQQKLAIENTIAATTAKNIIDRAGLEKAGATPATIAVFDEAAKKNLDILNLQKSSIDAQNASKLYGIEISKQTQLQLAAEKKILDDQKYAMDNLVASTNSLALVLGDVGKKFGEGLTGLLQANQDSINARTALDKKYAADKTAIEIQMAADIAAAANTGAFDVEASAELKGKKELAALEQKNAKDSANLEFAKNAKMISSFKNMFSEKTFAYKALANIEKVMHISKLAMEAKEMATSLFAEGKKLFAKVFTAEAGAAAAVAAVPVQIAAANSAAAGEIAAAVPGIFAKFSEMMGPWGWAAAAAVVAALGFSGGGGMSKPPMGFSAEEQQKVQGTGQVYRDGKLMDTGAGALGDPTQKSESVANGIANIEKYSFDGLDYSNKMLEALKSIKDNTANLSTAIFRAVPGLNIKPADINSGNWLFGKSTSAVVDAGVILAGSFGQLIDRTGELSSYINTVTTSSGLFGFGSETNANSEIKTINNDSDLARVVSSIIGAVGDALSTAGSTLGIGMSDDILESFRELKLPDDIKASILGLKPSEQSDAILQVISAGLDLAAKDLFSSLEKYQKAGETFGDTVLRLANDTTVVNKNFQMLGISLTKLDETTSTATTAMYDARNRAQENLRQVTAARNTMREVSTGDGFSSDFGATLEQVQAAQKAYDTAVNNINRANAGMTTNNIALYDAIIKASGGLDKFTENTKAFSESFLTDREKITPRVDALHTALVDLTYGTITTRDEFKQLILGFKITNETSAQTYAKLIALSAGFDAVAQFEEKLADSRDSQTDTIRKLIGTEKTLAASLKASRDRELKAMDPSLVATQKYINALTDEVAARDKAATAVKSTIDSLKGSVTTLTDYQTSLKTSAQGTMTPEQRYAALQQELLVTQTAAMGPTGTPAQLATQQAAAAKLPQAASAFLDASKVLNASSSKYSDDLAGVQKIIADTITSVTGTQTLAEKNLAALGPLVSIDASATLTAKLMQDFLTAQGVTETARIAMDIATNQWHTNLLAALNPIELVGPVQQTAASKLAADASTAAKAAADKITADQAAIAIALVDGTAKITVVNDSLVLSVGALDKSSGVLTTAVGAFGLGVDSNTASVLTAVNSNLTASGVLDTSMRSLNTNVDDLSINMSDNTASLGYLGSEAFARFLAKAVGDAIDTGSIVEAINDSTGAQITANATVVANQTLELTNNATDNIETIKYNGRNYKLYPNQMEP